MQKKRKKAVKEGEPGEKDKDWEGSHPWRPFDRDKDLQATKPRNQAELVKQMGDLGSRFGTSNAGPRKFL